MKYLKNSFLHTINHWQGGSLSPARMIYKDWKKSPYTVTKKKINYTTSVSLGFTINRPDKLTPTNKDSFNIDIRFYYTEKIPGGTKDESVVSFTFHYLTEGAYIIRDTSKLTGIDGVEHDILTTFFKLPKADFVTVTKLGSKAEELYLSINTVYLQQTDVLTVKYPQLGYSTNRYRSRVAVDMNPNISNPNFNFFNDIEVIRTVDYDTRP